ncbi:ABC transporter ATP-binding protein [Bradyrhizobium australiense]|uniref:sn-glycerol-3-phosphate ABC transporter ATP-binding protein UgpC n=1 Tax=Bradyrhizobium australiense TaxID=2721161 RepID=A0A7Y4GST7_9BRAD|nr:sn-glycerol-3-phosphate ABC transporter ATP-binding protein UgpC [Bradyrhizobium australiense]NOJ41107.1 sn-glycerol-3-phosphate ABC transporter ATP-binding protein UgpC [Bradyrhizobium australiense]
MAEVTLQDVVKKYGTFKVVHEVNLNIAAGEFVVLVGPSGCGKSTTLRMIAGLENISAGTIRIGDKVVNDVPPKDRDIAMVFQNYALYQHMTVFDNLAFGLRNRKVPETEITSAVTRATQMLGLEPLLARKPFQLSGGQQQRVALGRCIVRRPQVFLFDEPLSNLDAKLRAQMRIEIKALRERVPTTSVYVTHDQVEAMTLGDRVVVMKDGWIQQIGTPLQIYNRPANRFVASFIGAPAMNFMKVELVEELGVMSAQAEDFKVELPLEQAAVLRKHGAKMVILGIRPEHIRFGIPSDNSGSSFSGVVTVTEQLGSEQVIALNVADSTMMASRISPETEVSPHASVQMWVDAKTLQFFDDKTEMAIR